MARIETRFGNLVAPLQWSEGLMEKTSGSFSVHVGHDLVQRGAFKDWQPVRINIPDGGDNLQFSAYVESVGIGRKEDITVNIVGIEEILTRVKLRASQIGFDSGKRKASEVVEDLIAFFNEGREMRRGWGAQIVVDRDQGESVRDSAWYHEEIINEDIPQGQAGRDVDIWPRAIDGNPNTYAFAPATSSSTTATLRRLRIGPFRFVGTEPITKVLVHLRHQAQDGPSWANKMRLIKPALDPTNEGYYSDTNQTFATIDLPAPTEMRNDTIDITEEVLAEYTDVNDLLNSFYLDFIVQAGSNNNFRQWRIADIQLEVFSGAGQKRSWPIFPGRITEESPDIWPGWDNGLKTAKEWLDWISEETGYEWRIVTDPTVLGGAFIDFQETVGSPVTFGTLQDGINIQRENVVRDAQARYSRVRITRPNSSTQYIATDEATLDEIRLHEYTEDSDASTAEVNERLSVLLAQVIEPILVATLIVPLQPNLWSGMLIGDTVFLHLNHAPIFPFDGIVRLMRRRINTRDNTAVIDVMAVTGVIASETDEPEAVARTVSSTKKTPKMQAAEELRQFFRLSRRENRST